MTFPQTLPIDTATIVPILKVPMNVNINYYGHSVNVIPEDIADNLDVDATEHDIRVAIAEDIEMALQDDPASYRTDEDDVVERVQEILAERKENPDA